MPPRIQFTHGPGVFLREKRSSRVNLRVFYAQFTLGSPHSFIYLGPGGAIKSAINHNYDLTFPTKYPAIQKDGSGEVISLQTIYLTRNMEFVESMFGDLFFNV